MAGFLLNDMFYSPLYRSNERCPNSGHYSPSLFVQNPPSYRAANYPHCPQFYPQKCVLDA